MKDQSTQSYGGNPLVYLFKKTWQYSEGNRKSVVAFWIMFIINEVVDCWGTPILWASIFQTIQEKGITSDSIHHIYWLLGGLMAMVFFVWSLHGPARYLETKNAFLAKLNYRKFLLRGVMTLPMEWHTEHHSGDTIDKIEKGTGGLNQFAEQSFEILYAIVKLIISFGMLAYFFPPSSYMVLIMLAITVVIVMRFDKVLIPQYRQLNEVENKISASVVDSICNITTVIILRVEQLVFSAIIKKAESPFELFKRNNRLNEIKWFLTAVCCRATVVLVMWAYFVKNIGVAGGVMISSVYLLYNYLGNITDIFYRFASMYSNVVKQRAKVANAEALSRQFVGGGLANHVLPKNWRGLAIKGLSFSYNGDAQHLDNVELTIRSGEKIAFVGRSGSGKTTLLKIMRGLYKPTSLDLTVDGVAIQDGFDGISRAIALIPQSPEIFATTMLENLTLGAEYDDAFIRRYTDMAAMTEVIEALPKGFDSSVTEKGVSLSGGQQQRLALARGLIACHGKDIALLDEPTASLDSITEREIYRRVFEAFTGKTVVSSIHRLHLLPMFDRVCMFEDGKIVGLGTFAELLCDCPAFAELWRQYGGEDGGKD